MESNFLYSNVSIVDMNGYLDEKWIAEQDALSATIGISLAKLLEPRLFSKNRGNYIQWWSIFGYFNGKCGYCLKEVAIVSDHIVPHHMGVRSEEGNLVPSCVRCNSHKTGKSILEWLPNWKPDQHKPVKIWW